MEVITGLDNLATAWVQQPNEVCLTLYFEPENTEQWTPILTRIQALLQPEVKGWQSVKQSTVETVFQAVQVPSQFTAVYLVTFVPILSQHTRVIQVVLNQVTPLSTGWPYAARWLYDQLYTQFTQPPAAYFGYTLIFRATLAKNAKEPVALSPTLLDSVRWVHQPDRSVKELQVQVRQPIGSTGWLFLVSYPVRPLDGFIYIALGKEGQPGFAGEAFVERLSWLAGTDTFVQKSLFQWLDLTGRYDLYEQRLLEPVKTAISDLLTQLDQADLQREQLKTLAQQIAHITDIFWKLNRLEQSLQQQITGIQRYYNQKDHALLPDLASYHLQRILTYLDESQALVRSHRLVLDTARTAISMVETKLTLVETQQTKQANDRQERFTTTLTIIGMFLTAEQLLDDSFAKNVLASFRGINSPEKVPYFDAFLLRCVLAFLLAYLAYLAGKWIARVISRPQN